MSKPQTKATIADGTLAIIREFLGVQTVELDSKLKDGLCDSLDLVEIAMALEDEFHLLVMPDAVVEAASTPQDFANSIAEILGVTE